MSAPNQVDISTQPIDALIGMYVNLRDRIKGKDDEHKEKMKPAKEFLETLNAQILAKLNETGGESIRTDMGTAYRTEKKSVLINDVNAFRDLVVANELWDMLDWKANATAVDDYLKEFGELPPGTKMSSAFVVGVRRPNEK